MVIFEDGPCPKLFRAEIVKCMDGDEEQGPATSILQFGSSQVASWYIIVIPGERKVIL